MATITGTSEGAAKITRMAIYDWAGKLNGTAADQQAVADKDRRAGYISLTPTISDMIVKVERKTARGFVNEWTWKKFDARGNLVVNKDLTMMTFGVANRTYPLPAGGSMLIRPTGGAQKRVYDRGPGGAANSDFNGTKGTVSIPVENGSSGVVIALNARGIEVARWAYSNFGLANQKMTKLGGTKPPVRPPAVPMPNNSYLKGEVNLLKAHWTSPAFLPITRDGAISRADLNHIFSPATPAGKLIGAQGRSLMQPLVAWANANPTKWNQFTGGDGLLTKGELDKLWDNYVGTPALNAPLTQNELQAYTDIKSKYEAFVAVARYGATDAGVPFPVSADAQASTSTNMNLIVQAADKGGEMLTLYKELVELMVGFKGGAERLNVMIKRGAAQFNLPDGHPFKNATLESVMGHARGSMTNFLDRYEKAVSNYVKNIENSQQLARDNKLQEQMMMIFNLVSGLIGGVGSAVFFADTLRAGMKATQSIRDSSIRTVRARSAVAANTDPAKSSRLSRELDDAIAAESVATAQGLADKRWMTGLGVTVLSTAPYNGIGQNAAKLGGIAPPVPGSARAAPVSPLNKALAQGDAALAAKVDSFMNTLRTAEAAIANSTGELQVRKKHNGSRRPAWDVNNPHTTIRGWKVAAEKDMIGYSLSPNYTSGGGNGGGSGIISWTQTLYKRWLFTA